MQGYFAPGKFALDDSHMYQAQLVNLTGHLYNNFQAQLVPLQVCGKCPTVACRGLCLQDVWKHASPAFLS
jgi:hypothetical protein